MRKPPIEDRDQRRAVVDVLLEKAGIGSKALDGIGRVRPPHEINFLGREYPELPAGWATLVEICRFVQGDRAGAPIHTLRALSPADLEAVGDLLMAIACGPAEIADWIAHWKQPAASAA